MKQWNTTVSPGSPSRPNELPRLVGSGILYDMADMDHPKNQPLCLVDWTSRVSARFGNILPLVYCYQASETIAVVFFEPPTQIWEQVSLEITGLCIVGLSWKTSFMWAKGVPAGMVLSLCSNHDAFSSWHLNFRYIPMDFAHHMCQGLSQLLVLGINSSHL